jgi:drug/metabolite transporter (DMT)-like permease
MKYVALTITLILFSTIEVAVKLLGSGAIDPILLAALRFLIAGLIMLPFCKVDLRKFSKKEIFTLLFCAIVGIVGCFIPYHTGVPLMPASSSALIFCLNPAFAVFFAHVLLKEKISPLILIGLILGISGVYVSTHGFLLPDFSQNFASVLLLISAITFGVYTAASKKLIVKYSSISITGLVFTIGGLFMLPFVQNWNFERTVYSISIIAYLIFAATAVGYFCFFYALKRISVAAGSSIFFLKPILAAFFSFLLLQETFSITYFLGMAVSLLSLFMILYADRRDKNG